MIFKPGDRDTPSGRDRPPSDDDPPAGSATDADLRYRSLVEHAPFCIHGIGLDGRVSFINPAGLRMLNLTGERQVVGQPYLNFVDDKNRPCVAARLNAAFQGEPSHFDFSCASSGRVREFASTFIPVFDAGGAISMVMGTSRDITEERAAARQLKNSQQALQNAQARACLGIWEYDPQSGQTIWSDEMYRLYYRDRQSGPPQSVKQFAELLHVEDRAAVIARHERILRGDGPVGNLDLRTNPDHGPLRWLDSSVARVTSDLGGFRIVGTVMDVTERKEAAIAMQSVQAQLRQSERRYRTLVEHAPEAIVVFEPQTGCFVDFNGNALQLFGCDATELKRCNPFELSPPRQPDGRSSREAAQEYIARSLAGEHPVFEWTHRNRRGEDVLCEIRLLRIDLDSRVLVRGSITDISERKQAERQLRMTRFALESTDDAMFVLNAEGRIIDVNAVACRRLKYVPEQLLKMSVWEINPDFPIESWQNHWEQLKQSGRLVFESVHRKSDGTCFPVEISKSYFTFDGDEYAVAFVRDILQRKQTEECLRERESQLAHVSRLSTMGEMVAGIAHELNQPLYSIVNFSRASANVLGSQRDDGRPADQSAAVSAENLEQVRTWNDQIAKAATRAGQIIHRLRGFVQRETSFTASNLHDIIQDALELVSHESRRAGISISVDRSCCETEVYVDRVRIQQVLVNLLINAIEAIQSDPASPRRIDVAISSLERHVQVSVVDSGPGLRWEDNRKMFAPFETTKKEGMGMGLAISSTIIETMGGELWAQPNPRGGATFSFTLPLQPAKVE